jgi:prevent-host-death family protein
MLKFEVVKQPRLCYSYTQGEQIHKKGWWAMQTLSVREMRNQLGKLDELLSQEQEILITRHNTPVARILPITRKKKRPDHKSLRECLPYQDVTSETLQRMDREER